MAAIQINMYRIKINFSFWDNITIEVTMNRSEYTELTMPTANSWSNIPHLISLLSKLEIWLQVTSLLGDDNCYISALAKVKQKGFTESRLQQLKQTRKLGSTEPCQGRRKHPVPPKAVSKLLYSKQTANPSDRIGWNFIKFWNVHYESLQRLRIWWDSLFCANDLVKVFSESWEDNTLRKL